MKIVYLEIEDFRRLCYEFAQAQLSFNEPIPNFESASEEAVKSILLQPKQTFDKKPLYKTLEDKAAIIFYLFIKNHPFENGNKRVALVTLFVFLALNNRRLKTSPKEIYLFALGVAKSKAEEKNEIIEKIKKFVSDNCSSK